MNKDDLFKHLETQPNSLLLELLDNAYDEMSTNQRHGVFGDVVQHIIPATVNGETLIDEIDRFFKDSLDEVYYAPFDINSKNYMDTPEETDEWFDLLGDFLDKSVLLSEQGDHHNSVECFGKLFQLTDDVNDGREIVFGDEIGSWMIPGDEKERLHAYVASLSVVKNDEMFVESTLPLIRNDSFESFSNDTFNIVLKYSSSKIKPLLKDRILKDKIRIKDPKQLDLIDSIEPNTEHGMKYSVEPITPINEAVTHDAVICLICGKKLKVLKGHLTTIHDMDVIQYKKHFKLPNEFPMIAPSYSEKRSRLEKEAGLDEKLRKSSNKKNR